MTDESNTSSPVIDYLTREANQTTVHRALESLEEALSQLADNDEYQEQLQRLERRFERRFNQFDSRLEEHQETLDNFDERLTGLEDAIDSQNELLSELMEMVEINQEAASGENSSESPDAIVNDRGAMVFGSNTSANYLLCLEVEGIELNIGIELNNGSGHATVEPGHDRWGREHQIQIGKSEQFEFTSLHPDSLEGRLTYQFQSEHRGVFIYNLQHSINESYQIVSAEPQ